MRILNRSMNRTHGWPVTALGLVALGLVAVGCGEVEASPTVEDLVDRTESELIDQGASPEIAACVVRLGRHDLRLGPLDEVATDELTRNCERAREVIDGSEAGEEDSDLAFIDAPDTLGDDPGLDRLWRLCEEGSGAACNDLFQQAPIGSDYEAFGVSCGRRDDVLFCSELDDSTSDGRQP